LLTPADLLARIPEAAFIGAAKVALFSDANI
jgi:hypothetical protein